MKGKPIYFTNSVCFIVLTLSALILVGCGAPTQLMTRYSPLHPDNNETVTFTFEAEDNDGISKAELFIYEYELYVNNGMQSARQRSGGQWGLANTWNYSSGGTTVNESYNFTSGFPAESFIKFLVRITDDRGRTRSEDWFFAAGDWPFGNSPIPIWGNGAPADRIDVAFVADRTDFSSGDQMLGDLEGLIFDGYHTNNAIENYRHFWSFYYSPETGFISDYDSGTLDMDIPSSVQNSSIIDHAAVIHTTVKRDWASGGNFGTEPTNIGTAVHESAHAAFGLSDEYSGGGHSTSSDPHHNNYNSESDAENYNTNNGWPASDVELIQSGWWRPEPSSLQCIMLDDRDSFMPDFERTCYNRAIWYYIQLAQ